MKFSIILILASITLGFYSYSFAGEIIGSAELRRLFIGNTVHPTYIYKNKKIDVWEYFHKDGTLYILDGKYGKNIGKWEIRDDGCFYSNYDSSDKYDGCYYYEHDSGNIYRFHRPWSDEIGSEELLQGNPKQLGVKSQSESEADGK